MKTAQAMEILGIDPDVRFSAIELKTSFRRMSLIKHPDAGGSVDEFNELQEAYEVLKGAVVEEGKMSETRVVDGTLLSELGRGYPLSVSARLCEDCEGRGYREFESVQRTEWRPCSECEGSGLLSYPCNRCGGTGRYKHPRTGKDVGECFGCKGSGKFYPKSKSYRDGWFLRVPRYIPRTKAIGVPCKVCGGKGESPVAVKTEKLLARCVGCSGIGEIKIWNPVIPRGFLAKGG